MTDFELFQEAAELELSENIETASTLRLQRNYIPDMNRLAVQLVSVITSKDVNRITTMYEANIRNTETIAREVAEINDEGSFEKVAQLIFLNTKVIVGVTNTLNSFGCGVCSTLGQLEEPCTMLSSAIYHMKATLNEAAGLFNDDESTDVNLNLRQNIVSILNAYLVLLNAGLTLENAKITLISCSGELATTMESVLDDAFKDQFDKIITEKANMDDDIRPIIKSLNAKGYKTKYSSSGHPGIISKNDRDSDKVKSGRLYIDARIMFDGNYKFPEAPKWWVWRQVDGNDYLDVKEIYLKDGESPSQAKRNWKSKYMGTLRTWVEDLPSAKSEEKPTKE